MQAYQDYIHISKYARYLQELDRRENWQETVDRFIQFWMDKFPKVDIHWEEIRKAILFYEVMPSMRALMTAGLALEKDNMAGYNPVIGSTKVLTKEYGYLPIEELSDKQCHVLNRKGEWAKASFTCYGEQEIFEVTTRKNSNTIQTVECTANHRWFTSEGKVKPTSELIPGKKGDKIPYASWQRPEYDDIDYSLGIVHGLIFGDGTQQFVQERTKGYTIRLCSDAEELLPYFKKLNDNPNSGTNCVVTYPESFNGDPVVQLYGNFAKTHALKDLPKHETESYMIGFFRGWFAADGYVGIKTSQVCICMNEDYVDWFQKYSAKYGYVVQNIHELPYETNFGKRKKRGFNVVIDRSSITHNDFIITRKKENFRPLNSRFSIVSVEKTDRVEKVYCAEVPDTNTFVLERGMVTGNCAGAGIDTPRIFDEAFYILMCGTGFGFSVERKYVEQMPTINDEMHETDTVIVVKDSKIGWARALKELIAMLYTGNIPKWDLHKVRPAGAPLKTFGGRACLTGDTILYKDRKKARGYNEITIKDLFDMERSQGKWKGKPNHFKSVKLRSLDEETGQFYRNNVITVVDNGVAPIYEILTENGYRIKATGNHRFMKETGDYEYLDNFNVGDLIAVNGSTEKKTGICMDCGCPVSRRAVRCKSCNDINQISDSANDISARSRKECRDYTKEYCEHCNVTDTRFEIHHIDENPHNNDHDNLENLCCDCHQKEHAKRRTFPDPYSHKYLSYDSIISITYMGEEQVYDLQMEAPNHNFVANGFVSHNSGPEPLDRLFKYTVNLFKRARGTRLTSIQCHDLMCMIAKTVIVGSVRRSACISFSNLSDDRMRRAKNGEWQSTNPERYLANNSVMYTCKPDVESYMKEFRNLYVSKSGERGICNQEALQKKARECGRTENYDGWFVLNPCGEAILRSTGGLCNLSEIVARSTDTEADLKRKARIAAILGTLQSTLTDFRYVRKVWKKNAEEDRLLGVSITGVMDHPVLCGMDAYKNNTGFPELKHLLQDMKKVVKVTNVEYSDMLGINAAKQLTLIKPSGTVSQLVNCSAGMHPRTFKFINRKAAQDAKDPLTKLMIDQGIPHYEDNEDQKVYFEFPIKPPENSITNADVNPIFQLELWKVYQQEWCDGNPSQTVYYTDENFIAIQQWVWENWDNIGGLSFFPLDDNVYDNAPFNEITEEEYERRIAEFPEEIDWSQLSLYENGDQTNSAKEIACSGSDCTIG